MLPAALACTLVKMACLKARLLVRCCRLDVSSCICMYSGENGMFEGTFVCTLMQIGCYQLSCMQFSEHGMFEGTLACTLVQIGVTSCNCMYSGEDGMLEGTFAGL